MTLKELWRALTDVVLRMPRGFVVTFKHMFKKPVTLDYPRKREPMAPRYKGLHYLERYEDGSR